MLKEKGVTMQWFSPLEYIQIDIASQFGLNDKPFDERIAWVNNNETILESLESQAKKKTRYRYIAAVMAYREVQAGLPTGHRVGFDASASGPQIMAAVMRDPVGARNTSLIGSILNDVYKKVTEAMNTLLKATKVYDRGEIKGVLMPVLYGSKKKPKIAFGEDTPEYCAFQDAKEMVCPGAAYLMPILNNSWNAYATEHAWNLPDGFEARVKVDQVFETDIEVDELDHLRFAFQYTEIHGTETGLANIANTIQSLDGYICRELTRRCDYNKPQFQRVLTLLKKRAAERYLNDVELNSIQKIWRDQNIISLVDLEELQWSNISFFDFNYCEQLIAIVERCLSRPSFHVISIHKALWM